VQNCIEGTAGFLTVAFPLWIDTSSQVAAAKPIKTKILTTWRLRHAPADLCE
jgi:hypothetical protein